MAICSAFRKWVQRLDPGVVSSMVVQVRNKTRYTTRLVTCDVTLLLTHLLSALIMDAGEDDVIVGQSQRSPVPSFLFLLVMIFLLTSHNGDEFVARHQYQSTVQVLQEQLGNYTAWEHGEASNFTMVRRSKLFNAVCHLTLRWPARKRLQHFSVARWLLAPCDQSKPQACIILHKLLWGSSRRLYSLQHHIPRALSIEHIRNMAALSSSYRQNAEHHRGD